MPTPSAMTFFIAPLSSTPLMSSFVYTRMTLLEKTSCTNLAASMSELADTMVVGRSTATSSAWVGPDSATRRMPFGPPSLPSSSAKISVMVYRVSGSMPFATSTMIWSSAT